MENKNLIDEAIKFIQKSPKENLSLQSIADNAGFSLNYFDTIFRQHTGYSPVEYSRVYKLTRSALELRRTEKSILEISLDFGYSNPESFTRAFKSFYSIAPSEYREKYSAKPVTWHDLSGKIAISHFRRSFPELKVTDVSLALDYCFTHGSIKYAEDIINMTIIDSEILTLGNTEQLEHFIYVSDYNKFEPVVTIVCENEADAILYLKMLSKQPNPNFTIHKPIDYEWEQFDAEAAKLGLTCCCGYDMFYPYDKVTVPKYDGLTVRELTADDISLIKAFRQNGGCANCHVKAVQIHFEGKGNVGLRAFGTFLNGNMVAFALPTLDQVRDMKRYDIGGIFTIEKGNNDRTIELIWKHIIDVCLKENAIIGNGNALEENSPIGTETSEHMGLIKVIKNCRYSK